MNSCGYELEVRNAGPPYEGTLGVACEEAGDAIEFIAYKNSKKEELLCKAELGPQESLQGLDLATSGEGAEREISLEGKAEGLQYDLSGPCVAESETKANGALSGAGALAAPTKTKSRRAPTSPGRKCR